MTGRKLPEDGTIEAETVKERYKAGDLLNLTKELEFANIDSLKRAVRTQYRLYAGDILSDISPLESVKETVVLPEVKLREYKSEKRRGDEETAVVLFSDGHGGKITKSFNKDVYRSRMETLFQSIMTIINLHRNMYPIRKLVMLFLGDNVQGENPYQGSVVGNVEMGARDQTIKIVTPACNDLIGSLKQHFVEVKIEAFAGNHGYERNAPETSREDFRLYDILQSGICQEKGINIKIHEQFSDIIDIGGFRFFCFHGDGISSQQGVPEMAVARRLRAYFIQYDGFHYACCGHFHTRKIGELAKGVEFFMNSTLVSDDDWALKKLGVSSQPSQWILGLHPRMGLTWRYSLVVDEAFLPART